VHGFCAGHRLYKCHISVRASTTERVSAIRCPERLTNQHCNQPIQQRLYRCLQSNILAKAVSTTIFENETVISVQRAMRFDPKAPTRGRVPRSLESEVAGRLSQAAPDSSRWVLTRVSARRQPAAAQPLWQPQRQPQRCAAAGARLQRQTAARCWPKCPGGSQRWYQRRPTGR